MSRNLAIAALLASVVLINEVSAQRSPAAVREFRHANPCPATGKIRGACPGYVVDHVEPLCAGGADRPSNMQWQTVAEAKRKDVEEHRLCRELRRQFRNVPQP